MSQAVVEMSNITKIFNNKAANSKVDFRLRRGSIHGLLGENGAGKTTLMNILYGLYKPEAGDIYINGHLEQIESPEKAISLGIGMVHQHFMLASPFTVTENIMAGSFKKKQVLLHKDEYRKAIVELAERYKMSIDPDSYIWQNSVGEQQRIEILSVLFQDVDILILDEPTAVLTPSEVDDLFVTLKELVKDGKSIILITHKLDEILQIADEVTVLRNGENVGCCDIGTGVCTSDLSAMMVGYDIEMRVKEVCTPPQDEIALEVSEINVESDKQLPAIRDLSFNIRKGEILGVAGVDGNGQKELCEVLAGLRPLKSGTISVNGNDFSHKKSADFIESKVAYVPEDRKDMGLALDWDVSRNLVLKNYGCTDFCPHGIVHSKEVDHHAESLVSTYDIRVNTICDQVKDLSGGNQQKVILARELQGDPDVLIANQPTRGVDINAALNIRNKIIDARNKGTAVLLISADLEEIMHMSDRIAVLYKGELNGLLPGDATIEEIGPLMLGKKGENNGA